ncbi:MAG TPA: TadE/TadG family type IV pilus assembly protein [Pyrinomonadaceae bacterium]|jgi:Flp pilus assembly protein TadG
MNRRSKPNSERGAAVVEFTLVASFFLMMLCAIVSGGHLFFTHNAMVEATRRGARYAATQCKPNLSGCPGSAGTVDRVKNMVLYGTPTAGTTPLVYNLQASNITVTYSNDFNIAAGTVSVQIDNYQYVFAVGGLTINMPHYHTTVTGESAGFVPNITCP